MTEEEFRKRFKMAAIFCHDFTNKHIDEELPKKLCFVSSEKPDLLNTDELIPKLYKDNKVPVWITLYVITFNSEQTIIKIDFSDEFSEDERLFFHKQNGMPPFHISGPTVPEGWKSLEESGTFPFEAFR